MRTISVSDLCLMGHRQLLNLLRGRLPRLGLCRRLRAVLGVDPQDADTYVHLHITLDYEEGKGWLLYATATIETGMVVIADAPYAIVPAVPPIATKP